MPKTARLLAPLTAALFPSVLAAQSVPLPDSDLGLTPGASCSPGWRASFGGVAGANSRVRSAAVFDDGSGGGPALYIGGDFTRIGDLVTQAIARWDGASWSPLGSGMDHVFTARVDCLAVFDDGNGPALHAGGIFTSAGDVPARFVARWDGASWSTLSSGTNGAVQDMLVFDDGSGAGQALYCAGSFITAGGAPAAYIARWNGSSWSPVGGGMNAQVKALAVFDDGSGPALHAAGNFTSAGGVTATRVAKWNGTSWSPLGSGMSDIVAALEVFDDGSGGGPALYAAGAFVSAGGLTVGHVARWDGSAWSALGSGMNYVVKTLGVHDDGGGPALYAGGLFTLAGGTSASNLARWDGTSWSAVGSGADATVDVLQELDDGSGPALIVGGAFSAVDGLAAEHVARLTTSWSPLGNALNGAVRALEVVDGGGAVGTVLVAGGLFVWAGTTTVNRIASWDGAAWSPLGNGTNGPVEALAQFEGGGGAVLFAGGSFTSAGGIAANRIARWNGQAWSALGSGMNDAVTALETFDADGGPALYAGGSFTSAGGAGAQRIARWNGLNWSVLGSGVNGAVNALAVFDDGLGPALFVGGGFTSAGGGAASHVARWDGVSWSPLGGGTDGLVDAFTVFDDGGGPALYASGAFTAAGGMPAANVARWDGQHWSPLGTGTNGWVRDLSVLDDGGLAGRALYAGGFFTSAGGVGTNGIARWDGAEWSPLASGVGNGNGPVDVLAPYDAGDGPALLAGGSFVQSGEVRDSFLARWQGCADTLAPTIACPVSLVVRDPLDGPPGEWVTFSVTASDNREPAPFVHCVPRSGSFFPQGTTLVTCTATDAAGNESTCSFPVTVQPKIRER